MPGNYELYDPAANKLGSVICKLCWETSKQENSASLETVWVSIESRRMVWWLCHNHTLGLSAQEAGPMVFLKSSQGVVLSPGL